jgi:hypothetical protein
MPESFYVDYKEIQCDPLVINFTQKGTMLSGSVTNCKITIPLSISGKQVVGVVLSGSISISITPALRGIVIENRLSNWVQWTKIGRLDFTIDESNLAGKRPLDWAGYVYQLLKLDNSVIAYGENGVSALTPNGVVWGLQGIYPIGVQCRTAIAGDDNEHFFVDSNYRLFRLTKDGIKLLDYSEYISSMVNPVLTLDSETGYLYICDGVHGYIYSSRFNSFGEGPINVTGFGLQSGTTYVTAPSAISTPKFQITTDIYDMGTRKPKTITCVEVGVDLANYLEVMIEARVGNNLPFIESPWVLVNPDGRAWITCYGLEFKIHLRSYTYEYFKVDYLKVNGLVHQFNYADNRSEVNVN